MYLFLTLFGSVISAVFLSLNVALYLPVDQVNRMFVSGLSAPALIIVFAVWSLRSEHIKVPMVYFILVNPVMLASILFQLL